MLGKVFMAKYMDPGSPVVKFNINKTSIAYRLEFECTNNTAEYEALLKGLKKALDMDVRNLMVFGDS